MKRAIFSVLMLVILAGLTGCVTQHGPRPCACMGGSCAQAPENGQACGGACCEDPDGQCAPAEKHCCPLFGWLRCKKSAPAEEAQEPGPATGAVAYPYYTVRGPRDFLAKNPPSIGP
jgi:hypothetical protein